MVRDGLAHHMEKQNIGNNEDGLKMHRVFFCVQYMIQGGEDS